MPEPRTFPDLESARAEWEAVVGLIEEEALRGARWFQGAAAGPLLPRAVDYAFLPWTHPAELASLNIVRVNAARGEQDYFLPLILLEEHPGLPNLARLSIGGRPYVLAEASLSRRVATALLAELARSASLEGRRGRFAFHPTAPGVVRAVEPLPGDYSNTVLHLHRDEVQKITRRLWPGRSREIELASALKDLPFIPDIHGHLAYEAGDGSAFSLAVWEEFLPNRGSLWDHLTTGLSGTIQTAIAAGQPLDPGEILTLWLAQINPHLERLGGLLAELHAALARVRPPAPFTAADLEPISRRIRAHLQAAEAALPPDPPDLWQRAADLAGHLEKRLEGPSPIGQKILTHGDFHLGQILLTEDGYAILDLEGEPMQDPEVRAAQTTPLRDLAGLVRSFSYAGQAAYLGLRAAQRLQPAQEETARFLAERFAERTGQAVIRHYGAHITRLTPGLIPDDPVSFVHLLDLCRLEKAAYEIVYEMANRPTWLAIPLDGLRHLLAEQAGAGVHG